jgi:AAA+ superfamily predicted ATPase
MKICSAWTKMTMPDAYASPCATQLRQKFAASASVRQRGYDKAALYSYLVQNPQTDRGKEEIKPSAQPTPRQGRAYTGKPKMSSDFTLDNKQGVRKMYQGPQAQEDLINEALRLPASAVSYYVTQQLATLFPDKALIESDDSYFNVKKYSEDGQCTITALTNQHNEVLTGWYEEDYNFDTGEYIEGYLIKSAYNTWQEITWHSTTFTLLTLHWELDGGISVRRWLLADTEQQANQFMEAVCRWNAEMRSEILVFDDGDWQKDERLFQAIKNATFDNLVLPGTLKEEILSDLQRFFSTRTVYQHYHLPWKRGILFIGTPGNGKTHTVKALTNALNRPCLYVKSFKSRCFNDDKNISMVFAKARKVAPCLLILEDLDSLLTDENRSFFLNELDGFATNDGVVILATTNHPEKLDPALLDRPSRFDRKYHFNLPALAERVQYIKLWNASLQDEMRLSEQTIIALAETTQDFSFAYLKELFLSSMMNWMAVPERGMDTVMFEQVTLLKTQMTSLRP